MLNTVEAIRQNILYYFTPDPITLQGTPILQCVPDVLTLIGRLLSREDAISFTSTCTYVFNLRRAGITSGIILGQVWRRIPQPDEKLSSFINLPNGREITERQMVNHEATSITELTLAFTTPLKAAESFIVAARLRQYQKVTKLHIDCAVLTIPIIYLFLMAVTEQLRSNPIFSKPISEPHKRPGALLNLVLFNAPTDILSLSSPSFEPMWRRCVSNFTFTTVEGKIYSSDDVLTNTSFLETLEIHYKNDNKFGKPNSINHLQNLKSLDIKGYK